MTGRKRRIDEGKEGGTKEEDIILLLDDEEDDDYCDINKKQSVASSTVVANSRKKPNILADERRTASIPDQGIDIKIPLSLLMTGTNAGSNECAVLVQVTPEDAPTLDFHGAAGAVGRFEVNDDTVTMDLKGFQYQGGIQAGPTCIIASMHPLIGENVIKVESITDEFVTLQKTGDQLKLLDAVVEKGDLDDSFFFKDTNVNSRERGSNANSISNSVGIGIGASTNTSLSISNNNNTKSKNGNGKSLGSAKKDSKPSKRKRK